MSHWERVLRWLARRLCAQVGWTPVPLEQYEAAIAACRDLGAFVETSGFLRDGRYPGGRHAERKIRNIVSRITLDRTQRCGPPSGGVTAGHAVGVPDAARWQDRDSGIRQLRGRGRGNPLREIFKNGEGRMIESVQLPESITRYLKSLTEVEEDRVLTTAMGGYSAEMKGEANPTCLVMAVTPGLKAWVALTREPEVTRAFDRLAAAVGNGPTAAAIRDYILSRRAARTLAPTAVTAEV